MIADTCIEYVIPATERGYNIEGQLLYERAVSIVHDADGDYYRSYDEFPANNGSSIVNHEDKKKETYYIHIKTFRL